MLLAHHSGAVLAAEAVAMLCADIPMEKMRKLEVYTFGSAAAEFVMPVGEGMMEMAGCGEGEMMERKGVHVEHFAMAGDPVAEMGVMNSVRRDMGGRYCGGVFVMNHGMMGMMGGRGMMMMEGGGMMMEDYMMAMFPSQMGMAGGMAGMMDCVMHVDRDCAEKREIAAMACYQHAASRAGMMMGGSMMGMMMRGGKGKRMSWTGLAAGNGMMNGGEQKNGMSAGQMGLEMARKGCQECKGHMGREVSWLARYVGGMMMMGMDGKMMGMGMGMGMDGKMMDMDGKMGMGMNGEKMGVGMNGEKMGMGMGMNGERMGMMGMDGGKMGMDRMGMKKGMMPEGMKGMAEGMKA